MSEPQLEARHGEWQVEPTTAILTTTSTTTTTITATAAATRRCRLFVDFIEAVLPLLLPLLLLADVDEFLFTLFNFCFYLPVALACHSTNRLQLQLQLRMELLNWYFYFPCPCPWRAISAKCFMALFMSAGNASIFSCNYRSPVARLIDFDAGRPVPGVPSALHLSYPPTSKSLPGNLSSCRRQLQLVRAVWSPLCVMLLHSASAKTEPGRPEVCPPVAFPSFLLLPFGHSLIFAWFVV